MIYKVIDFVGTVRVKQLQDETLVQRIKDLEWHYRTLSEGYWTIEAEPYGLHVIHDELNSCQKRKYEPGTIIDCPTRRFGKLINEVYRSMPGKEGRMTDFTSRLN